MMPIEPLLPSLQLHLHRQTPLADSFRTRQIAGQYGLTLAETLTECIVCDLPDLRRPWRIGLITGPSGSGKSSVARQLFGESVATPADWPRDRAIIDSLGELTTRQLARLLTAVGLGSIPAWLKPYHVLSTGQRFRCDLAHAFAKSVAEPGKMTSVAKDPPPIPTVVYDEFSSTIDRTAARMVAATVAKAIRREHLCCRFVAVTCHDDVAVWLAPDWTLDMGTGQFARRSLRRPPISCEIYRYDNGAWRLFRHHHYLSGKLSPQARCYVALWNKRPVGFCAVLPALGHRGLWRITRLVVLPDFQGLGLGMRLAEAIAAGYQRQGLRMNISGAHPALIAHCRRSPCWRCTAVYKYGQRGSPAFEGTFRGSYGRPTVTFSYVGECNPLTP